MEGGQGGGTKNLRWREGGERKGNIRSVYILTPEISTLLY